MAIRHPHAGAPSRWHSLLEWRALAEIAALPLAWPLLGSVPQGDGHPVVLLPGFMADESSLVALKRFLKGQGYAVQTWGLGRNIGFQPRHAEALVRKIADVHLQTGRTVSLVGWSLGGVFALYGGLTLPKAVRHIVALGSPVNIDIAAGSQSPALVQAVYRWMVDPKGPKVHADQPHAKALREHRLPAMPMSCLYSLSDGVVPPQEATIDGDPSRFENIRVSGSHTGMGFNAMVLAVVADRLAQPEGQWRPFKPAGWPGLLYRSVTHALLPL